MGSFELNFLPAHPLPKQIIGVKFMNKPLILYTALTKAVDNYNTRHHYSRSKLADDLGFVGENAAIQLSNALNPMNHDKTLNDEKKCRLLHTLEYEDLLVYFNHYMRQFGLRPVSIRRDEATVGSIHSVIDEALIVDGEAFKITKDALRDKTLTAKELEEIIVYNRKAAKMHFSMVDIAIKRLRLMEVR